MASLELRERPSPPGSTHRGEGRRPASWALLTLLAIVAVAGWLRFASLGRLSLWADETLHAIPAKNLIEGEGLVLPSGREYRRALAQTLAVAGSMKVFGENEAAARAPSALAGLATIPLVWIVLRRRFGEAVALGAAAALTVMPLHIAHSRSARFYAAFVIAYGAVAVLGTRAIEARSLRAALLATLSLGVALHLQIMAVMVVAPLALYAALVWLRAPREERASRARIVVVIAALVVAAVALILGVSSMRDTALQLVRNPVPGVVWDGGLHLETVWDAFSVVSWWAWIPLAPAAIAGLRRAGRNGASLLLHTLVPTLVLALWDPLPAAGINTRYLIHLTPFVVTIAAIGVAEMARFAVPFVRRLRSNPTSGLALPVVVALATAAAMAGGPRAWTLPNEPHPTRALPRPNWKAAAALIRTEGGPRDGLLTTFPLATSWTLGRCGGWLRSAAAARPYEDGDRDVYCGSELVANAAEVERYMAAHSRGWILADPAAWVDVVPSTAREFIEHRTRRVAIPDGSLLIWRWEG